MYMLPIVVVVETPPSGSSMSTSFPLTQSSLLAIDPWAQLPATGQACLISFLRLESLALLAGGLSMVVDEESPPV